MVCSQHLSADYEPYVVLILRIGIIHQLPPKVGIALPTDC